MNPFAAAFLAEAAAFTLAATRVAGFTLATPFPGRNVPVHAKVGLVLALAWVARGAAVDVPTFGLDLALVPHVATELGLGLAIGFTVRVTFSAAEVFGDAIAQATGMTLGQAYDASLGSEDLVVGRLATTLAMLLFLALGAHRVVLGYLVDSFRALPVGAAVGVHLAAPVLVDLVGEAIGAGVRLALPVTAVGLGVQTALALVARASPSLQMFSVGLAVSVAAGMLALLASLEDTSRALAAELARLGPRLEAVLAAIAPR